jgi:anti-anti-sigma regulatory factor
MCGSFLIEHVRKNSMSDPYVLPPELNIYNALQTREAILAWAAAHSAKGKDSLPISAQDVAEVDGAGLQLLAALSNMDQTWRLVDASAVFREACQTLGFGHWLDGSTQGASA